MLIAGAVIALFILGLFFEALGSGPKSDAEWQNDTDRDIPTGHTLEVEVPVTHA